MLHTSNRQDAQARTGAQSGAGPIDHAVLGKLLCDDREAVGEVLRQFRVSCPADASALIAALSRNDGKEALRWAHRLRGACELVGAARLAGSCERVEVAVRAGDAERTRMAVSDIDIEAQRIGEYLEAWLKVSA